MTHSLKLVAGSTEIELTSGNYRLLAYTPSQAEGGGVDVLADQALLVAEEARVDVLGADGPAVQENFRALESLLLQARRYEQQKTGDRVYVVVQMSEEGEAWRSPLVSGRVEPDDDTWRLWANHAVTVSVIWSRRNYFEAMTEAELALGNSSSELAAGMWMGPAGMLTYAEDALASTTGGVIIYNHDDGDSGHDNWVHVESDQLTGVLPAPVKMELEALTGATPTYSDIWIGCYEWGEASDFREVLEGEDGTGGYGTASIVADANSSGGNYISISWSVAPVNQTSLWSYELTSAMLADCGGRWFQVLARFASAPATSLRLQLYLGLGPHVIGPSATVAQSIELKMDGRRLVDFGALQLPPLTGVATYHPLWLNLAGRQSSGGSIDLDFVALLPLERHRVLRTVPVVTWSDGEKIIEDGIDDLAYAYLDSGLLTGNVPVFARQGPGLWLWPGRDQRVYVLSREGASMLIDRRWIVRMWYRARRRTL